MNTAQKNAVMESLVASKYSRYVASAAPSASLVALASPSRELTLEYARTAGPVTFATSANALTPAAMIACAASATPNNTAEIATLSKPSSAPQAWRRAAAPRLESVSAEGLTRETSPIAGPAGPGIYQLCRDGPCNRGL